MSDAQDAPLPAVCVVCAEAGTLEPVVLERVFTPSWVWLLLPLGILPAALVAMAVQTRHRFSVQLCRRCRTRQAWAGFVHWLALLACLALFFAAIAVGVSTASWSAFLLGIGVMIAVAAAASRFDRNANPRCTTLSAERVEIEVPGHGRYVVFPPYYLLPTAAGD